MFVARSRADLDCASTAVAVICKPGVSTNSNLWLRAADRHTDSNKLQRPANIVRPDSSAGDVLPDLNASSREPCKMSDMSRAEKHVHLMVCIVGTQ